MWALTKANFNNFTHIEVIVWTERAFNSQKSEKYWY